MSLINKKYDENQIQVLEGLEAVNINIDSKVAFICFEWLLKKKNISIYKEVFINCKESRFKIWKKLMKFLEQMYLMML